MSAAYYDLVAEMLVCPRCNTKKPLALPPDDATGAARFYTDGADLLASFGGACIQFAGLHATCKAPDPP